MSELRFKPGTRLHALHHRLSKHGPAGPVCQESPQCAEDAAALTPDRTFLKDERALLQIKNVAD